MTIEQTEKLFDVAAAMSSTFDAFADEFWSKQMWRYSYERDRESD